MWNSADQLVFGLLYPDLYRPFHKYNLFDEAIEKTTNDTQQLDIMIYF